MKRRAAAVVAARAETGPAASGTAGVSPRQVLIAPRRLSCRRCGSKIARGEQCTPGSARSFMHLLCAVAFERELDPQILLAKRIVDEHRAKLRARRAQRRQERGRAASMQHRGARHRASRRSTPRPHVDAAIERAHEREASGVALTPIDAAIERAYEREATRATQAPERTWTPAMREAVARKRRSAPA